MSPPPTHTHPIGGGRALIKNTYVTCARRDFVDGTVKISPKTRNEGWGWPLIRRDGRKMRNRVLGSYATLFLKEFDLFFNLPPSWGRKFSSRWRPRVPVNGPTRPLNTNASPPLLSPSLTPPTTLCLRKSGRISDTYTRAQWTRIIIGMRREKLKNITCSALEVELRVFTRRENRLVWT